MEKRTPNVLGRSHGVLPRVTRFYCQLVETLRQIVFTLCQLVATPVQLVAAPCQNRGFVLLIELRSCEFGSSTSC